MHDFTQRLATEFAPRHSRHGAAPLARAAFALASLFAFALPACETPSEAASETGARATIAECPVCKSEGDLACVRVEVEPDTPRYELDGVVYYFCSEQCRSDFMRRPQRYLAH